jgi:glucose-1-phosphate thymidylyltransferase
MTIAKAIVLAGDCRGSAPWPDVGLVARQLAPVANRPVLFHHLDALAGAEVREVAMVTDSTTHASIRDAVGDGSEWGVELTHLEQDGAPNVLASPVLADFVGSGPVLVAHGDVLLRERLTALNDDFADRRLDALILRPGGAMGPGTAAFTYCIIGPDAYARLRRAPATLNDALPQLGADGARIGVREVDACMPCRGGAEELLEANRRMLDQLAPQNCGERVFDSQIQGRVSLHPSCEIRSSIIRGPVAIGAGACITDAYIGPYTSIGAGVEIDSVEIEHSIVFDRARIQFISTRIEGSLVGPGATVTRDFKLPRALRLSVGEGAQITLA